MRIRGNCNKSARCANRKSIRHAAQLQNFHIRRRVASFEVVHMGKSDTHRKVVQAVKRSGTENGKGGESSSTALRIYLKETSETDSWHWKALLWRWMMLQEVPSCEYLRREGHIMRRVGCTFAVVPFYCVVLGNSIFLFYREKVNLFTGITLCQSIDRSCSILHTIAGNGNISTKQVLANICIDIFWP